MFYGPSAQTFKYAKQLRGKMTVAEEILWKYLSKNQMNGYRFKRQHPIRNYIADFYCHKATLLVEVDGGIHETEKQMERDREKTAAIEGSGCRILRFTNDHVVNGIDQVLNTIKNELPPFGRQASHLGEVGGRGIHVRK